MKKNDFLKSITAILLILVLLMGAVPAMAASKLEIDIAKEKITILRGKKAVVLVTKANVAGTLEMKLRNAEDEKKTVIQSKSVSVSAGTTNQWELAFDEELAAAKVPTKHLVYTFTLDGKEFGYSVYLTYDSKQDVITVEKGTWYPNNTACSFGLPLRDMKHPITDKWYHVTPVDLSVQGEQSFLYLASNKYIIGEVTVSVYGDNVHVDYRNYYENKKGNTQTLDEFMTLFHDLNEVTVNPENAPRQFAFGQKISIQEDLEGDTNVLLFILNHVTYCDYVTHTHKLTRFWPNLKENIALRSEMELLMNQDMK